MNMYVCMFSNVAQRRTGRPKKCRIKVALTFICQLTSLTTAAIGPFAFCVKLAFNRDALFCMVKQSEGNRDIHFS